MANTFLGFNYATPLTVTSNQPEVSSDTLNLRRQSISTGAQRWEMQIPLETDAGGKSISATVQTHKVTRGSRTAFAINMPQHPDTGADNINSGTTLSADTEAAAGSSTVSIDNSGSGTYNIPLGRYITFANHNKVYLVTSELDVQGGGSQSLSIYPSLVQAVPDNTRVIFNNVEATVKYNNGGIASYTYTDGIVTRVVIDVVESL